MGDAIVQFYKQKLKKEWKIAFFSTFFVALLTHLYKLTNTLLNHDSVYNYYSKQNMVGSGRWALSVACGIGSYFDLPWLNGLLCCLYIALTAVVIVALFRLTNPVLIGLTGAIFAVSPAVTETLFFNFTADGYFLSMLLSALAVFLSRMEEKRWYYLLLSGVCVCIACGIYQAYVSFGLVLAVCYLMDQLLQGKQDKKSCWLWVWRQVIIYAAALVGYYVIWKLCLLVSGISAEDYQGISQVKFSVGVIAGGFLRSAKTVMLYFTQWNIIEHGLTFYCVINLLFLVALLVGLVIACVQSGIYRKKWAMVLLILCVAAWVPFTCIWHFTSATVVYRPMMLFGLVMLFVFGAILYERWAKLVLKNAMCLLLALIVFQNVLMANMSYFYMHKCQQWTYAEGIEMVMKIHQLQDEQQIDKIAVLGYRPVETALEFLDKETGDVAPAGKLYMLSSHLETSLLLSHEHTVRYLKETYGLEIPSLDYESRQALEESQEAKEMGCWPAGDSMVVIDGVLIIKLA